MFFKNYEIVFCKIIFLFELTIPDMFQKKRYFVSFNPSLYLSYFNHLIVLLSIFVMLYYCYYCTKSLDHFINSIFSVIIFGCAGHTLVIAAIMLLINFFAFITTFFELSVSIYQLSLLFIMRHLLILSQINIFSVAILSFNLSHLACHLLFQALI